MLDRIKELFLFGKKEIVRIAISFVLLIIGMILITGYNTEASAGLIMFFLLSIPTFKVKGKGLYFLDFILAVYSATFVMYYFQLGCLATSAMMTKDYPFWGYLLIGNRLLIEIPFVIVFYSILRMFAIPSRITAIITPIPFLLLSSINYCVLIFRGREMVFSDIYSVRTAINVMSSYVFPVKVIFAFWIIPYCLYIMLPIALKVEKSTVKFYVKEIVFSLVAVASVLLSVVNLNSWFAWSKYTEWGDLPSQRNGFFLNFLESIKVGTITEPRGYSSDVINQYLEENGIGFDMDSVPADDVDDTANIIVVMNESYSDLSIYDDITGCNTNPDPFWDSLDENTVRGYAFSSVYGGNTCNSEFEYLTSMSMAFFPSSSVVYNSWIHNPTYSINWALKDIGYETMVMHPYVESGWNRTTVYPLLGFDKMVFMDDFDWDQSDVIHGKISDYAAYRNITSVIDSKEPGSKMLLFMITIQNHSGYYHSEDTPYPYTTAFDEYNNNCFNTYQSYIKLSDEALEMLIDYLSTQDEKYELVVFGDHQPSLNLVTEDDYAAGGKAWIVPYIIWTNYDIDEEAYEPEMGYTSLNYLALDTLTIAGVEHNSYYSFIDRVRSEFPVINSAGFITADGMVGEHHDYSEQLSNDMESDMLMYNYIVYDQLFGENKSNIFVNYLYN